MTVKGEFIRRILNDESGRWSMSQSRVLNEKLTIHEDSQLFNNRSWSQSHQGDLSATLIYQHTIQERFLDLMAVRYGSKIVRRHRKIHTRFIYAHYESIASRLMYGLTDDVVAMIKRQIES